MFFFGCAQGARAPAGGRLGTGEASRGWSLVLEVPMGSPERLRARAMPRGAHHARGVATRRVFPATAGTSHDHRPPKGAPGRAQGPETERSKNPKKKYIYIPRLFLSQNCFTCTAVAFV